MVTETIDEAVTYPGNKKDIRGTKRVTVSWGAGFRTLLQLLTAMPQRCSALLTLQGS